MIVDPQRPWERQLNEQAKRDAEARARAAAGAHRRSVQQRRLGGALAAAVAAAAFLVGLPLVAVVGVLVSVVLIGSSFEEP